MDWYAFGLLLYDHMETYLIILAGSLLLYLVIFKNTYLSLLDPLVFNLLFSVFGFSVVIFLYTVHAIQPRYFYSYLLTQTALFAGLFLFRPLDKGDVLLVPHNSILFEEEGLLIKILFLLTTSVFTIVQLLSYKLVGIPLLMQSRIGAYADSGGLGMLGRIIDVLRPANIFLLIYFYFKSGKSFRLKLYMAVFTVLLLLFIALSGSKSLFMTLGFILFIYLLQNASGLKGSFLNLKKYERYLIISGLIFAFFTIVIQANNNPDSENGSLYIFLYRLVASGDTYFFAYPNNNIELINGSKWFLALFGDIFSTLRIIPRAQQPGVLGVQLFQMFSDADLIAGPNARHNVFGYVYYGFYGSVFFSFSIGALLSFVRNKAVFLLKNNILGQVAFMFLYLNLAFVETDPPQAIQSLENVMLIFPVFIALALVLYVPLYNIKHHVHSVNYKAWIIETTAKRNRYSD